MTWKAETLKNAYKHRSEQDAYNMGLKHNFNIEGKGLTYEDYWIYTCLVGYPNYRKYRDAHARDVDITTKVDVWNKLQETDHDN